MSITPGPWEAVCVGVGGSRDNPTDLYEVTTAYAKIAEFLSEADARAIAELPTILDALKLQILCMKEAVRYSHIGRNYNFGPCIEQNEAILKRIEG